MQKIQKITGRFVCDWQAVEALLVCYKPFGSLTFDAGVAEGLAKAMLLWVSKIPYEELTEEEKLAKAGEIFKKIFSIVRSATTDHFSTVEFGASIISLHTPNSRTRISLGKYHGDLFVEVDFGPNGSESRANDILSSAKHEGVEFETHFCENDG